MASIDKIRVYNRLMVYPSSGVNTRMQIREYLSHRAQHLAKTSQRIKDFRVFDFNGQKSVFSAMPASGSSGRRP